MFEYLGYLGGFLLAICGIPEAYKAIKEKQCNVGNGMLFTWLTGEMCLFFYVIPTQDLSLILNYLTNIIIVSILVYYKVRPKGD